MALSPFDLERKRIASLFAADDIGAGEYKRRGRVIDAAERRLREQAAARRRDAAAKRADADQRGAALKAASRRATRQALRADLIASLEQG